MAGVYTTLDVVGRGLTAGVSCNHPRDEQGWRWGHREYKEEECRECVLLEGRTVD